MKSDVLKIYPDANHVAFLNLHPGKSYGVCTHTIFMFAGGKGPRLGRATSAVGAWRKATSFEHRGDRARQCAYHIMKLVQLPLPKSNTCVGIGMFNPDESVRVEEIAMMIRRSEAGLPCE